MGGPEPPNPGRRWAEMEVERACFNCNGTMVRATGRIEPGWYCSDCDTFSPDDQPSADDRARIEWLREKIQHYRAEVDRARLALEDAEKSLKAHHLWLIELLDQ